MPTYTAGAGWFTAGVPFLAMRARGLGRLFGLLLWQTSYIVAGGSAWGFGLALIGLVVSFFGPRTLAKRWKSRNP